MANEKKQRYEHDRWWHSGRAAQISRRHRFARIFWGVFFVGCAAILILSQTGVVLTEISALTLVISAFLLAILLASLRYLMWFGVFASITAGVWLYQEKLIEWTGWTTFFDNWWAIGGTALLLAIGFSILFHRRNRWRDMIHHDQLDDATIEVITDTDRVVRVRTVMGETIKYIDSQNLERVILDLKMGAQKIYFDGAKPSAKGVDVVINSKIGGIELFVPKHWNVIGGVNSIAGGVSRKNEPTLTKDSPVMRLHGTQKAAGVEITFV